MLEVAGQSIGQVDRRVRQAAQLVAGVETRRRTVEARLEEFAVGIEMSAARGQTELQRQRGITQGAGDADQVARLGAAAAQRLAGRQGAHGGDGDGQRPGRGVAADQGDAALVGRGLEPLGVALQPSLLDLGQGQGQHEPARPCAHGGEVGQAYHQGFPADVLGARGGIEMPAGNHGVGGDSQLLARPRPQHGAIIADAQRDVCRNGGQVLEMLADERELIHRSQT